MEFLEFVLSMIWVMANIVITYPLHFIIALVLWCGVLRLMDIILERWD